MRRLLHVGAVVTVLGFVSLAGPTAAFAKGTPPPPAPKLNFFNCATGYPSGLVALSGGPPPSCDLAQPGSVGWAKGTDSDGDHFALRFVTAQTTDVSTSLAGISILNTTVTGESIPSVQQLRMDTNLSGATDLSEFLFLTLSNGGFIAVAPQLCDDHEVYSGGAWWEVNDFRNGAPNTPCQLSFVTPTGVPGEFMGRLFQSGSWQYGYGGTDPGYQLNAWDWMDWYFTSASLSAPTITGAYLMQMDYNEALTGYVDNLTFDNTVFTTAPGLAKKS